MTKIMADCVRQRARGRSPSGTSSQFRHATSQQPGQASFTSQEEVGPYHAAQKPGGQGRKCRRTEGPELLGRLALPSAPTSLQLD